MPLYHFAVGSWASIADRNAPGDGDGVKPREKPCGPCCCTSCLSTCIHINYGSRSSERLNMVAKSTVMDKSVSPRRT